MVVSDKARREHACLVKLADRALLKGCYRLRVRALYRRLDEMIRRGVCSELQVRAALLGSPEKT